MTSTIEAIFRLHSYLKQGYRYRKVHKTFSKFYRRYSEFTIKFNIGLTKLFCNFTGHIRASILWRFSLLKFKRIVEKDCFLDQFKKNIKCFSRVWYNMDIMRQFECLLINSVTVYSYVFFFDSATFSDYESRALFFVSILYAS